MKTHNSMMITGQRSVNIVSLAGHLSTIERHEAEKINDALFEAKGWTAIVNAINEYGFKKGEHMGGDKFKLIRIDNEPGQNDTEINNAYIEGSDKQDSGITARVEMNSPTPASEMIGSSNNSIQNSFKQLAPGSAGSSADIYDRIERAREEDEE